MARCVSSPDTIASPMFGRMPAVTTTVSQSSVEPSVKRTPDTAPSLTTISFVFTPRCMCMPMSSSFERSTFDASASSCWFISTSVGWTTCTASPWACSPAAASSPSRPPPMTTAVRRPSAVVELRSAASPETWRSMLVASSRLRNPNTPGVSSVLLAHMPSMGGKNERLPVARISVSYGVTDPSSP